MKNELALFQPAREERAVDEVNWINYRPVSQISNSSAIEFSISGTGTDYIQLSKTRLYLQLRLLRPDGTPVDGTDDVALVNIAPHALFRQVDVMLNQKLITSTVGVNYPYKAMLDIMLSYGHDIKDSQLQAEGYVKDSAGQMDDTTNSGHMQRKNLTKHGIVDYECNLHVDVCQMQTAIINGVQITVKLFQHDDSFRLLSANAASYSVELIDAVLKVCHIKVKPSVTVAQDAMLDKVPALYNHWTSSVKSYSIPQGSWTWSQDDVFHGLVPTRLYVAIVSSAAYSGSFAKNPFNFHHYFLNYLELAVDGHSVPSVAFQPHYQVNPDSQAGDLLETGYVHEFLSLFKNSYPQLDGNFIQRKDFPSGYCVYCMDLCPGVDGKLFSTLKTGHTRLNARFAQELPEPVTVIVYGAFPSQFKIDQTRNVII